MYYITRLVYQMPVGVVLDGAVPFRHFRPVLPLLALPIALSLSLPFPVAFPLALSFPLSIAFPLALSLPLAVFPGRPMWLWLLLFVAPRRFLFPISVLPVAATGGPDTALVVRLFRALPFSTGRACV